MYCFSHRHSNRHAHLLMEMSATCVQRLNDSRSPAIHTRYRSWLRSSSLREPRYPPLRVVSLLLYGDGLPTSSSQEKLWQAVKKEKRAYDDVNVYVAPLAASSLEGNKKTAKHRSAAVEGEGWRLPVEKLPVVPSHPLNGKLRPAQRRWKRVLVYPKKATNRFSLSSPPVWTIWFACVCVNSL